MAASCIGQGFGHAADLVVYRPVGHAHAAPADLVLGGHQALLDVVMAAELGIACQAASHAERHVVTAGVAVNGLHVALGGVGQLVGCKDVAVDPARENV